MTLPDYFAEHDLRQALNDEFHARPPVPLESPTLISYLAMHHNGEPAGAALKHLINLGARLGRHEPAGGHVPGVHATLGVRVDDARGDRAQIERRAAAAGPDQLQERLAHRGLAAARFADQRQRSATPEIQRNAVDRFDMADRTLQETAPDREMHAQVVERKQGSIGRRS